MMSEKKNGGVPAWQKTSASSENAHNTSHTAEPISSDVSPEHGKNPEQSKASADDNSEATDSSSPETRIEQIQKFLNDEALRNATLEQKVSFLESKGLSKAEIDQAVKQTQRLPTVAADTRTSQNTPNVQSSTPSQSVRREVQSPPVPNRDVPPIITYPEFLVQAQKPPPLITFSRLLNTAYIAAGLGASVYGASKYLITPMTETLTSARHEFATHAQEQVEALNTKLREVISAEPPDPALSTAARKTLRFKDATDGDDDANSDASSTSDPTELFHRDFGTQTSPSFPQSSASSTSSSSSSEKQDDDAFKASAAQTSQLTKLTAHLSEFTADDTLAGAVNQEFSTVVRVLNEYLESLAYPSYSPASGHNHMFGAYGADKTKQPDDEVQRVKAEIRSVKGVLLSARNFPGSGGGRRAAFPPPSPVAERGVSP